MNLIPSGMDRRHFMAGIALAGTLPALPSPSCAASMRNSFRPGDIWLDTAGKPIQAHGGSIIAIGDVFYWYGENKERTKPGSGIWHWGVRAYASKDLYNWDDLGLIIPPRPDDKASPLHPSRMLDRPHILHHRASGTFVCWIKIMEDDGRQTRTVLTANSFTGPYTILRQGIQPNGMNAGDFDLLIMPEDQKAYMVYERVHSELVIADMTADYTDFTGHYSEHFPKAGPPDVREGPAFFRRGNRNYLITSGTTSYHPNPSDIAIADCMHGPWASLGDLHPADRTRTSFNTQICSVFRHPAKQDLFIALADRWIPDLPQREGSAFASGEASGLFASAFRKIIHGQADAMTPQERKVLAATPMDLDTSESRYAWLPLRFDGERPFIEWRDEWRLDEFS